MNEDNNLEELEGQVKGRLEEGAQKAVRKISRAVGKAVKKVARKLGKAVGKLVVKVLAMIGPVGWLIIGVIIALLLVLSVLYGAYDTAYESKGREQEYQDETIQENNELEIDENGNYNVSALSRGNKTMQAFYTYFSNESYYKIIGDDKTLYKANEKKDVTDKYEREKMFYLNPNMLWTLDEYLNKDQFRFPEQFIQPVAYDSDTLELLNLCDEEGRLKVKSYDYSKKNNSNSDSTNEGESVEDTLGIIYIGDSRTVGLEKAISKASNEFFVAESKKGYDWFVDTAVPKVNEIIKENPDYKKWTIISNLGINDLGYQVSNYISKYNELLTDSWSTYNFCFQSVNPVDESKDDVPITNAQIESFNEAIKNNVPNARYINTYTTIKNNFSSSDGIHYDKETYKNIYNTIQNEQPVGGIVVDKDDLKDTDKTFGTWDYGFAPVLHYVEKEELKEIEGSYVQEDYWDSEDQEIKTRDINEDYYQMVEGYPKTVYMIDKVISSAGTIENKIESPKVQGGAYVNKELYDERDVDIYDWVTHTSTTTNEDGSTSTSTSKRWEKVGTKHIKLYKYIQAYYYDTIPKYVGEPDTSKITGNRYFIDYMTTYETYVPDNVMGNFDFKARTGKSETDEEIDKLIGADESKNKDDTSDTTSDKTEGDVNMDSFQLGSGASSNVYKKAIQHIALFKEWGETYGVDPYLLVAQACQESGGDHEATLVGGSQYNGAAVGIMQVEKPGVVITNVSAYNFKTKQYDKLNITGPGDVSNISDNIRVGAMELAERMKDNKGNILLALQGYNMGQGGISNVVRASGLTMDQAKSDPSNLTWMAYRHIQQGDPKYIENVLRYYASPENKVPYVILEDGTRYEANGSIETGFASGISISGTGNTFWGKIRSFFNKLVDLFDEIFPGYPEELSKNRIFFSNRIPESQTIDIITMMFTMNEMKYFSEYEITDKFWKEKYKDLFKSPLGTTWGSSSSIGINPNDYFPNGYASPISISGATIGKGFGNITNGDMNEYHDGIDIVVPEGTPVYAVADGTVETVKNTSTDKAKGKYIKLSHTKSIQTIYGNLESISVKEGSTVKKGDQIGVVGKSSSDNGLHFELINDGTNEDGSWIITGQGLSTGGAISGPQSIEGSEIAKKAYEAIAPYIGSWYAWGGTTPPYRDGADWVAPKGTGRYIGGQEVTTPGFDCSGLMWYAYKQAGIDIPRTTGEQQKNLKSVNKEDIKPGDLLLIGQPAHHVGMYIGNDQYIHAPQTGKRVTVDTVNWSRVTTICRVAE